MHWSCLFKFKNRHVRQLHHRIWSVRSFWNINKNQIAVYSFYKKRCIYVMRNDRTSNSLASDFLLSLGSVLAPKKYLEKNKPSPLYLVWKYIVVLQCVIPSRWCYNILLLPGSTTTNTWKLELSSLKKLPKTSKFSLNNLIGGDY